MGIAVLYICPLILRSSLQRSTGVIGEVAYANDILLNTTLRLWTTASGITFLASAHLNSNTPPSRSRQVNRRAKSRSPPPEARRFPFDGVEVGAIMYARPSELREREKDRVIDALK